MPPSKTANPDTPAQELARLAARYPAQALANPVLPLLLLENPAWFSELPEKALLALLGALADGPATAPPALLAAATPHKSAAVRAAAACLPALGATALATALHDADPAVRDAAYQHPLAALPPAEVPTAIAASLQLGLPQEHEVQYASAELALLGAAPGGWPAATIDKLLLYKKQLDSLLAERIAHDPALVAQLGRQVLAAPPAGGAAAVPELLRGPLAAHPGTPAAVLLRLAASEQPTVRAAVARNPAAPASLLEALATDASEAVLQGLAQNPAAPPALLAALVQRPYPATPSRVASDAAAQHPQLPAPVLAALLTHPNEWLRAKASQNPGLTVPGLRLLLQAPGLKDRLSYLRNHLAQALARPLTPPALLAEAAHSKLARFRQLAAAHPALPPAELPRLLRDAAQLVRAGAAASPHATPAQLAALAAGATATLREALAANPATPPTVLAALAAAPEPETRAHAAANPATPPATLAALATDLEHAVSTAALRNPLFPPELLAQRAATGHWQACALVALHPQCPPALLATLAHDERQTTQYPVAAHPATPPAALAHLRACEQAQPDRTLHRNLVLRQGYTPAVAAQLLQHAATTDRALRLLLQLGHPTLLADSHRAALAASPVAADRLSVAHLPEFQAQLRDNPHLLVRLVARGEGGST
ncbi:hypothetical protein GCM10027422_27540 [Hymenobacter arcticus]